MQNRQRKKGAARAAAKPHQVRIIGGQWKRTPLAVADNEGLRPTPDRVRETTFNWLNHLLEGEWTHTTCLDLFAGTGAMGFEAASRGASRVTMVEASDTAFRQLKMARDKLRANHIEIIRGDALSVARDFAASQRFDLIFLDPPYQQEWLPRILPVCAQLLSDRGMVYAEAEFSLCAEAAPGWMAGWDVIRADRAGMVFYHILRRNKFQA